MDLDPRGGHNRKKVNERFFKTWSAQMAYVLGYIFADGTIEDCSKSSRAYYLQITSKDKAHLEKITQTLNSNHNLYIRAPHQSIINGRVVHASQHYCLRIGNKAIYQDLLRRGVLPRKSLIMLLPKIPDKFFNFFLRGYFDGDGSLIAYVPLGRKAFLVSVVFTSGSLSFLKSLSKKLNEYLGIKIKIIYKSKGAFALKYGKKDSLLIMKYIYKQLNACPFLLRKLKIYRTLPK